MAGNNKTVDKLPNKDNDIVIPEHKDKKVLYSILGVITAFSLILLIVSGIFTFILKNNINGAADKYRDSIKNVPIVKLALPKLKEDDDPKKMSQNELIEKYLALKDEKKEFFTKEAELNAQIAVLNKYKATEEKMREEVAEEKRLLGDEKKKLSDEKNILLEEKKKFDVAVANADKNAYKDFYSKIEKETAKKIYTEIMQEQKASEETKKFVQIYEEMDGKAASKVLEELGKSQFELVVDILKNMKKEKVAEILTEMDASFAAKVSDKLAAKYLMK